MRMRTLFGERRPAASSGRVASSVSDGAVPVSSSATVGASQERAPQPHRSLGERTRQTGMGAIKIVLAVFMPPLAVYLETGVGLRLLVNVALTVLGIPFGIVHAVWVLSRVRAAARAERQGQGAVERVSGGR